MTLAEIADFVCSEVRLRDSESLELCKTFIRQRHEMIWDTALWKDTIYQLTFSVDTLSDDPEPPNFLDSYKKGIVYFPTVVDKILAVRTADAALSPEREENLYRIDIDQYEETGEPVKYLILPRACGHTYQPAAGWQFNLQNSTDSSATINADYVDYRYDIQSLSFNPPLLDATLAASQLDRVTKPVTNGYVLVYYAENMNYIYWSAQETELPRRARIKIVPNPEVGVVSTYRALVKRKIVPMTRDGDTSSIRNLDNVLVAFAHVDMLRYDRQHGKAERMAAEAITLFNECKKAATIQEAHTPRLIPEPYDCIDWVERGKSYW